MSSWWELGEHSGWDGSDLAHVRITCPFCFEDGNFSIAHRVQKKKPSGRKILNYDILGCANCSNYTMVFWSAGGSGLHDFRQVPRPKKRLASFPKHWPAEIGRYWLQAKRTLDDQNWDAAALMARSALQAALRDKKAKGPI